MTLQKLFIIGLIVVLSLVASACKKAPSSEVVAPAEQSAQAEDNAPAERLAQAEDKVEYKVNAVEVYYDEDMIALCKLLRVVPSGAAFKFCVLLEEKNNTFRISMTRLDDPSKNYDASMEAINRAIMASGARTTDLDINMERLWVLIKQCNEELVRRGFSQLDENKKHDDSFISASACPFNEADLTEFNYLLVFKDLDSDGKFDLQVFAGCGDICHYDYWRWNEAEQDFEKFELPVPSYEVTNEGVVFLGNTETMAQ